MGKRSQKVVGGACVKKAQRRKGLRNEKRPGWLEFVNKEKKGGLMRLER